MTISRYEKSSTILEGQTLLTSPPPQEEGGAMVTIPATGGGALRLSAGVMSKHLLAVGSIGSGKSTCLFHIVRSLADEYGVAVGEGEDEISEEELMKRAEAFAIRRNGRSPRTARQFIELLKIGL